MREREDFFLKFGIFRRERAYRLENPCGLVEYDCAALARAGKERLARLGENFYRQNRRGANFFQRPQRREVNRANRIDLVAEKFHAARLRLIDGEHVDNPAVHAVLAD